MREKRRDVWKTSDPLPKNTTTRDKRLRLHPKCGITAHLLYCERIIQRDHSMIHSRGDKVGSLLPKTRFPPYPRGRSIRPLIFFLQIFLHIFETQCEVPLLSPPPDISKMCGAAPFSPINHSSHQRIDKHREQGYSCRREKPSGLRSLSQPTGSHRKRMNILYFREINRLEAQRRLSREKTDSPLCRTRLNQPITLPNE